MQLMLAIFVLLNGQAVKFADAQPIKEGSRVLVPLRGVLEAMDATVDYDPTTRRVEITRDEKIIEMSVGRSHAWINGNEVALDAPVRVLNGRVLIPIRFVAENFGAHVRWNSAESTVFINTDTAGETAEPPAPAPSPAPTPVENGKKNEPPAIVEGGIVVRASTEKKTYRAGEDVTINIEVQNTDDRAREITYTSGQSFDVAITATGNKFLRWDWSHGMMFTMALRHKTLAPGEKLNFTTTWKQTNNNGNPMPRGEYSVAARLVARGVAPAPPFTITLVD